MIDSTVRIVVATSDWIKNNKKLIVTVFKVGMAIAAGGAAIVALGAAATGLGTVFSAAATVLVGIGQGIAILGTAIAALLSPIGLTIAGLAALVGYLVYTSGAGIRSCRRRSRTLRQGSVEARGRSGSYECHDLRDARPSALECSSDSFPNRCPPNVAIAFPRVSEARRSDSASRSLAIRDWRQR